MATILNTTQVYNAADVVTHTNLNQIISGSTFVAGVGGATDDVTLEVDSGTGSLQVKEIDTAQIKDASVTTAKLASATLTSIYDALYPVGSIYSNATDGTNPGTLLGFGTWVAFGAGRVPVGIDSGDTDFDTAEETGGSKTHTLTQAEIEHNHLWVTTGGPGADLSIALTTNGDRNNTFDDAGDSRELTSDGALSGSNYTDDNRGLTGGTVSPHNNLQPYIVVYMWKRTA